VLGPGSSIDDRSDYRDGKEGERHVSVVAASYCLSTKALTVAMSLFSTAALLIFCDGLPG